MQVLQVFVATQPCVGSSRSGVLKAELTTNATRYGVRLTGKVYAIDTGGASRLLTTVDTCLGSFSGTSSITLDDSLAWDCSEYLELRDVLVSWQSNVSFYPCGTSLPCSSISPKCNYYGSAFVVAGSEPPNGPPTAADNTVSVDEDTTHIFTLSEFGYSDPDGDSLDHVKITSLETNGELKLSGVGVVLNQQVAAGSIGQLTFTPFPDDYASAYASFGFKVHDGAEYSTGSYTMTIDVDPVNDPPVARAQVRSVVEGTSTGPFALAISDPDDLLADLDCSCISPPTKGSVAIVDPAAHTVNYTADASVVPTTDTFTYQVCDPDLACAEAEVTITITITPNSNPVLGAANQTTPEDTPVAFQVSHSDADNDTLTCTASAPSHGTISPSNWAASSPYPAKSLTYTPHEDFVGTDTVVIYCTDGQGGGDSVSVEIVVTAENDAPVAVDGATTLQEDVPVTASLSGHDSDGDPLTFSITVPPAHGAVSGFSSSSGSFTFTPDANYHGADTMTFQVCDPSNACDTGTFGFTIASINDLPVAVDDTVDVARDGSVLIAVLANDTDEDGDPLSVIGATPPLHGTLEIIGDRIEYSPAIGYYGSDSVTYFVEDPQGGGASARIYITVLNAPPRADAGGIYRGMVGEPVLLDARFSIDPNIEDTLQYRWDVNGDDRWDTGWLSTATVEYAYERPYRGRVTVEVRDLYFGTPIGGTDTASTFARIEPKPTQIAISVYIDLNSNGQFDDGDVGLPDVPLLYDGSVELFTGEDGAVLIDDVTPGTHTVRISEAGVLYLQQRGFFLPDESLASVELEAGDWVALFFSPEARGFLEVDLGADEEE